MYLPGVDGILPRDMKLMSLTVDYGLSFFTIFLDLV